MAYGSLRWRVWDTTPAFESLSRRAAGKYFGRRRAAAGFAGFPRGLLFLGRSRTRGRRSSAPPSLPAQTCARLPPQKQQAARLAQRRPKYCPASRLRVSWVGAPWVSWLDAPYFFCDRWRHSAFATDRWHFYEYRVFCHRHAALRPGSIFSSQAITSPRTQGFPQPEPRKRGVYLPQCSSCDVGCGWAGRWRSSQAPQNGGRRPGGCGQAGPEGRPASTGTDIPRSAGTGLKQTASHSRGNPGTNTPTAKRQLRNGSRTNVLTVRRRSGLRTSNLTIKR